MEKITIVTVTYNCKDIVGSTIKSVLEQTYSNKEYIIIDGKSTDGTLAIIEKYKDRITKFISEPDNGIYDAMNKAITIATGDWIIFMNAGDRFYTNNVLEKCFMQKNLSEYAAVYGSWFSVREDGKHIFRPCDIPFWKSKKKFHGMGFSHQSVFVRLNWARMYPFDLNYKCCADYNMIYTIYRNGGKFWCANIPIALFDGHRGFTDNHRSLQIREHAKILGIEHTLYFKLYHMKEMLKLKIKKIVKYNT